jgi:hypothetical protein
MVMEPWKDMPEPDVDVPLRARLPAVFVIVFDPLKNAPLLLLELPASPIVPDVVRPTPVLSAIPHKDVEVPLSVIVPAPALEKELLPVLNQTPGLEEELPLKVRLPALSVIVLLP